MLMISISVVSHRQANLVSRLLEDVEHYCGGKIEVILTMNVPEDLPFSSSQYSFPIHIKRNESPAGFGSNHNSAFKSSSGEYFCVVNPDIRFNQNPFPGLLSTLEDKTVALAAPQVVDGQGNVEDSARPFPRISCLLKKVFGIEECSQYPERQIPVNPDWVAGMFMLFRSSVFRKIAGFDERYFLYYEDVDICARLRNVGMQIAYCHDTTVIHNAQRDSHRKLRYLLWHLTSMMRYLSYSIWRSTMK